MDKAEMRETILEAKAAKNMTWEAIATAVGAAPVYVCSACLGESSMPEDQGKRLASTLGVGPEVVEALARYPVKGTRGDALANDPLVYRLEEIRLVYGESLKEIIHEKFGDGIMSAIDFTLDVDRVEDPKGDRVQITMCGKFLPYKRW